jgi:eukaryotic-like serine/threonine-protein kinase
MAKDRRKPRSQGSWGDRAFSLRGEIEDPADGAVYCITRFLGRGGMGEVYEVTRKGDPGARMALKCLQLQYVSNAKTIERTRREALTLRSLRHPNVVHVHAIGVREDGLIWMVMDLLVGHTLADIQKRMGRLPLPWALVIGESIARGLAAVHGYAVHRDIKPENIHLGDDGVVRVLDLGAGKFHRSGLLTTGGGVLGTVPYMSPEQLSTEAPIDGRSDLFSLGLVLAELISGAHPLAPDGLAKENVFTLVTKIIAGPPLSLQRMAPWVPDHIAAVVDRALTRDRTQRHAGATELADALHDARVRLELEVGRGEPLATLVAELNRSEEAPPRALDPLAVTAVASASVPVAPVAFESVDSDADTLVKDAKR